MTIRGFAVETGLSPAAVRRLLQGSEIDYTTLLKILAHYDESLKQEVEDLMRYVRTALMRRAKREGA